MLEEIASFVLDTRDAYFATRRSLSQRTEVVR